MPVHNPLEKLGSDLCQWGAGHDAVNVVGTNFIAGHKVSADIIESAMHQLRGYEAEANHGLHGWTKRDSANLRKMIGVLETMTRTDTFTQAYIDCALWASSADENGDSFTDQGKGQSDLAPDCLAKMIADCRRFQKMNAKDLAQAGSDDENGHDFFLTRCGHGVGFSDRGYGPVGDRLEKAAKAFGSVDLYMGDDGLIYCS